MQNGNAVPKVASRPKILVGFFRNQACIPGTQFGGRAAVELFLAEKVAVMESETNKSCRSCGERLKLIRTMVNSRTGSILHMFECQCGERTWDD